MDEQHLLDIAAAQHGLLTRDEARARGASSEQIDHRVETGRWDRVRPGVYRVRGAPDTWRSRLLAACLAANALASHRAAGHLWGLLRVVHEGVEVTTGRRHSGTMRGAVVHRCNVLLPEDQRIVDAIPVTAPELTLLHLGAVLPPSRIDGLVDAAIRQRLTTLARLRWRLRVLGRRGRNGCGVLRSVLDARDPRLAAAESELERRFLALVRRAGLARPSVQHSIRDRRGVLLARVDAAWPEARVAVELDGAEFHAPLERWSADLARQNRLVALGWIPLRYTWWDVAERPVGVISQLRSLLGTPIRNQYG